MVKPCSIVVACCDKLGIGSRGELPWKLRADMQFFKKLTTEAADGKENAVIMGRKTYFSIPEKFRPLKGRVNVVLSRDNQLNLPDGVHQVRSFDEALEKASCTSLPVDRVFVIGGSSIYQEAFNSPSLHRIYLTRIFNSINCDVFLPAVNLPHFKRIQLDCVPTEIQTEKDLSFQFQVYQRTSCCLEMAMMAAMLKESRGIGLGTRLPWPRIPRDYEYYTSLISRCDTPGGRVAHVYGSKTFPLIGPKELALPSVVRVVLSRSPERVPTHTPRLVADSMERALKICESESVERVWVMGGHDAYKAALSLPECTKIYLTLIEGDFDSDTIFPCFEESFSLVSQGEPVEENGVRLTFNVYERKDYSSVSADSVPKS